MNPAQKNWVRKPPHGLNLHSKLDLGQNFVGNSPASAAAISELRVQLWGIWDSVTQPLELLVTHFLWELIPPWNSPAHESPGSVSLLCLSFLRCAGVPPSGFCRILVCRAGLSSLTGCLLRLFTEKRGCVGINQGVSVFRDRALRITAAFSSASGGTKQIHLIYPKFPERQAFSLDLLCEKAKWRSLFCF